MVLLLVLLVLCSDLRTCDGPLGLLHLTGNCAVLCDVVGVAYACAVFVHQWCGTVDVRMVRGNSVDFVMGLAGKCCLFSLTDVLI